jgi:Core-2/I-Branching enzyme
MVAVRLACIVLAHRNPKQLALLLSALRHPRVRLYLHLDQRVQIAPFIRSLSEARVHDVVPLSRRQTRWAGPLFVDAALEGLSRGISDRCEYFILISGQDFPLRRVEAILEFVEHERRLSYVEYFPLPTARWRYCGRLRTDFYTYNVLGRRETCIPVGEDVGTLSRRGQFVNWALRARSAIKPKRRFPPYLRPFGGSSWWNVSRAAAEYVLAFVREHPDYRRYHEYTLSADEIFFQSILLGAAFGSRHEIVNADLRFTDWPDKSNHPRTLTTADLPAMLDSKALFARKFDAAVDDTVLAQLAEQMTPGPSGDTRSIL